MTRDRSRSWRNRGFTLAELAIVLLIVGLLIGGLLMPLSAQIDSRRTADTQKSLEEIRESLLGFAAAQGRLPCPAKADSASDTGVEDPSGGGACSHFHDGYVPAITLGINPTDAQGYAVDAWGNRIRYAVSNDTVNGITNVFTQAQGMRNARLDQLGKSSNVFLVVCGSATVGGVVVITSSDCGSAVQLTNKAPAIIYSVGRNASSTGGISPSENANPNPKGGSADRVFVAHEQTSSGSSEGEFDDIVTWLSPNILYNRMIAAGQLP